MGYTVTQKGFDYMNILGVFDRMLGPEGPSPIDLDVGYEKIREDLGDQRLITGEFFQVMENMKNEGLLDYSPD